MAVNVSQKDMTLREVIRRLREERAYVMDLIMLAGMAECATLTRYNGQLDAYDTAIRVCEGMLGYTGDMPTQVPNQSEGATQ